MRDVQNTHAEACAKGIVMAALQMAQACYSAKILKLPLEVIRQKGVVSVVAKSDIGGACPGGACWHHEHEQSRRSGELQAPTRSEGRVAGERGWGGVQ